MSVFGLKIRIWILVNKTHPYCSLSRLWQVLVAEHGVEQQIKNIFLA